MNERRDLDGRRDLDERLERELRGLLADRDPGDAPRTLRDRVDRVPAVAGGPAGASGRRRGSVALAVAGLAAAAVLVLTLVPLLSFGPTETGPGTSPGASVTAVGTMPPGAPFSYPEMRPRWATEDPIDVGTALPTVLVLVAALALVAVGIRTLRRRGRPDPGFGLPSLLTPRVQAVAWVGLAVAAFATMAATEPLSARVFSEGGPLVMAPGLEGRGSSQVTAPHPGQLSFLDLSIQNKGLLPVVVDAPARWPVSESTGDRGFPIQPDRFVTMRLLFEEALALPEPGPTMLWPGQVMAVRLLYRHLPCDQWGVPVTPVATAWPTIGPDASRPAMPDGATIASRSDVPLVVSVAGLPRTLFVETGFDFGMIVPDACPPTEALVPADVSRVPAGLALTIDGSGVGGDGVYGPGELRDGSNLASTILGLLFVTALAWPGSRVLRLFAMLMGGPRGIGRRDAVAVVVVAAAVGLAWWAQQPATLRTTGSDLAGVGMAEQVGDGSPDTFDVGPGGTLTFGFSLRNDEPVPLTILGSPRVTGQLELTGLGQPWNGRSAIPSDNAALAPDTEIAPGQTIELLGVAKAGACTRPLAESPGGWAMLTAIPFIYERLGIRHETLVPLARAIRVPADIACLAAAEPAFPPSPGVALFPVQPEDGVLDREETGPLPLAVMGGILVLAFVTRRTTGARRLAGRAGIAVLAAWAAAGMLIPVSAGAFWTGSDGLGLTANPNTSESNHWFVTAAPDEPFAVGLGVDLESWLPVRLDGVLATRDSEPWTAVWQSDLTGGGTGPPNRPFAGRAPDGGLHILWLVGRADRCAFGGWLNAEPVPDEGLDFASAEIRLRVSVLGWPRTILLSARTWPLQPLSIRCLQDPGAAGSSPTAAP